MLKNTLSKVSLTQMDFPPDNDPTQEGYVVIYDADVQFKISLTDGNYPNPEMLNIKIMVSGGEQHLDQMKIELSSENDLFFHFVHMQKIILSKSIKEDSYQQIKEMQQITAPFIDYPAICVKSFEKAAKDPNQYSAILNLIEGGEAKVQIIQVTEYKEVELIYFEFVSLDEETVRIVICHKYSTLKTRLGMMENKLRDINDVVKTKNPQLLMQMQKMKKQQ